jgi:hypothetical protein
MGTQRSMPRIWDIEDPPHAHAHYRATLLILIYNTSTMPLVDLYYMKF